MKLTPEKRDEYLKKVYAAWLGKVIGVRLGSPVENWTSDQIMAKYPKEEGYLVDYDIYASDDDTNGPLFFVRALLDNETIDAETIGNTFLNYLQEYKGFFWWGGVGVSTEHTAYENLKKGIKAPLSGSREVNGLTMAEQIGGQIFSDCWGYVAGYDADRAKKLAAMASSVTHDGNGIQGGIFVAVAITLAMQRNDIHEVIEETLTYLNKDMEYYKVARDILSFYEENKDDYRKCLKYIQTNYGYDKYPGVCHIIPNMALMIMAMSYGDNDFDKTLIILNRCGWDTDCNVGNVGSIMGALLGLEGISEKWILPINDVLNASSAIGSLNIQSVSESAKLFTRLAYKLEGIDIRDFDLFDLPYGTKGIRCNDGKVEVKDHLLHVFSKDIYGFAYYLADDLFDARYDPEFSPIVEPNDQIKVFLAQGLDQEFEAYVLDCEGKEYTKDVHADENGVLSIDMPIGKNLVINRIGLRAQNDYAIRDIQIQHRPKLEYDFKKYPIDHYGPRYGGDFMNNIRAFVDHSGTWRIEDGLLGESKDHALISSGRYGNKYHKIEWSFVPLKGEEHLLVFNMKGYLDRYAIGLRKDALVLIQYKEEEKVLSSYPLNWESGKNHTLCLIDSGDLLKVLFDEKEYHFAAMELRDLFGFGLGRDCINKTLSVKAIV